jgi:uncharacterized protein YjaG (DUF416 family)
MSQFIKEVDLLKSLDFQKQKAFAYLTCIRLYPNYAYFSKKFNFGNPLILNEGIEYIYLNILDQNSNKTKIDELISKIDRLIPETANFKTILASSALDACVVVNTSLDFLISKEFYLIDEISTSAYDTVHMFIQATDHLDYNTDKHFQQKIDDHPLMKKELKVQKGIISFLSTIGKLDHSDIDTLLVIQGNSGSLNLI